MNQLKYGSRLSVKLRRVHLFERVSWKVKGLPNVFSKRKRDGSRLNRSKPCVLKLQTVTFNGNNYSFPYKTENDLGLA